jgi:pimeloyl-ACP methyl ester carboxylesterase
MAEQIDSSTMDSSQLDARRDEGTRMERRVVMKSIAAATALAAMSAGRAEEQPNPHAKVRGPGSFITAADGTRLFYRDWGEGKPVLFCHPWGLNTDIWEYQLTELSDRGVRCIAYDRRGHGRSEDPGCGYDYDTLAADLAAVIEQLDLRDITLVGYSMGSGEAIHYISRYGRDRISRLALVSPVAPFRDDRQRNDSIIAALKKDRPAFLTAGLPLFLGGASAVSPPMAQWVLQQFLQTSPKATIECTRTIGGDDHRPLMKALAIPVLIIQGDHDEVCPLELTGRKLAQGIAGSELRVYEGAPHGIALTHRERFTRDLIGFVGRG